MLGGAGTGVTGVAAEEVEVPDVRLEAEVEQVTGDRDEADEEVDDEIQDHPQEDAGREPEAGRLEDEPRAGDRGEHVTEERDEADQRSDPDPSTGARDHDQIV